MGILCILPGERDGNIGSGIIIFEKKIMIIAEQKRRENIAEYLIYMYQVEDLIRASGFDLLRIEQNIINQFDTTYDVKREMLEWYKGLANLLVDEGKQKTGHMDFLNRIVGELDELNTSLLHAPLNTEFKDIYDKARANIEALRKRSGQKSESDVQLSLNGLYGLLILKLKKTEISGETNDAFIKISEWIAFLSAEYMKNESL